VVTCFGGEAIAPCLVTKSAPLRSSLKRRLRSKEGADRGEDFAPTPYLTLTRSGHLIVAHIGT
jgi:hypothetical protein